MIDWILDKGLVLILTGITSFLFYKYQEQKTELREVKAQLSEKRYKVYTDIFSLIFSIINDKADAKFVGERIKLVKSDLLLYAPDSVIHKFIEWYRYTTNNPNDTRHFKIYLKLMILVRKEMGHKESNVSDDDILRLIMGNDEAVEQIKLLISHNN